LIRGRPGPAAAIFFCSLIVFEAGRAASGATPDGKSEPVAGASTAMEGVASFYGKEHHGKKTANGETFDMNKLTAAHRALPFGAKVKVTNLTNNRSVIVRINDRGPFIAGRMIDLSQAAAERLDMIEAGVVRVKVQVLEDGEGRVPSGPAQRP